MAERVGLEQINLIRYVVLLGVGKTGEDCPKCYFKGKGKCRQIKCCAEERKDGNHVYFQPQSEYNLPHYKWSEDEEDYLKDNYGILTAKDIAKNLNRTLVSIYNRANMLNLMTPMLPKRK